MIRSNRSKSTLNNVFKTLNHTSNTFNISNSSRSGCSRSVRDQSKMIANRRLTTTRVLKVFLPNNKLNINQSIFVRHTSNSSSSASATVLNEESGENPTRKQRVPKRPSTFATYLSLTKPRLSSFVILSAGVGFAMAPVDLALVDFVNCVVGTSLTVASANAGNQWLEVEHDKKMSRTRLRALPRGLLKPQQALAFSTITGILGTSILYFGTNPTAALIAGSNILLYVGVYTPMKRLHWTNTWIGAVVGALPPMVGWTAATGGSLGAGAWALAAVLYAWQIPHFLSLSWTIRREYERGGYEMLARRWAHKVAPSTFLWALYTLPLGAVCSVAGLTTWWFALTAIAPGVPLVLAAQRFAKHRSSQNSRAVFRATLAWLPIFLGLMLFHKTEWKSFSLTSNRTNSEQEE